jgi:hypothetical protein
MSAATGRFAGETAATVNIELLASAVADANISSGWRFTEWSERAAATWTGRSEDRVSGSERVKCPTNVTDGC